MKNAETAGTIKNQIILTILTVALAVLILCPVAMLFIGNKSWSVLAEKENFQMILNSLYLGISVVIVSTLIAFPLAFIFSKTTFAKYKFADVVFMIPFMTPPYIASMGWILFMQKRGLLQQLLPFTKGWENCFFSFKGLVLVMSLHVFPFMYTMLKNAMLNIPQSLDEAASVFGAKFFRRLRKVNIPLLLGNYAIAALLVLVKTLSEYGTPATLGRRIGFDVFTIQIHRYATVAPVNFDKASALSAVLTLICIFMWAMQNLITEKSRWNLVGTRTARTGYKKLKFLPSLICKIYIVVVIFFAIIIPYFSIISTSLIKLQGFGLKAGNFSFMNYVMLFTENQKAIKALLNSLFLAVVSATICAVLGTLICITIFNSKSKLKKVTEGISLLPEMLPGIVLVLGIMIFWNRLYKVVPLYNTMGIMVLAYVVLFLPYTIQYVNSSLSQISGNLISAGKVFGASNSFLFRKITLPLIMSGIAVGWMMTFIISFRELVTASLIAPPNVLVVSTFITREFEQSSVSSGMAMAVICVLFTTTALLVLNYFTKRKK